MTTINTNTNNTKITRAEAMDYAIAHLNNVPVEIMDKLVSIRDSFTKKPTATESKVAKENKMLAVQVARWVAENFNETDPTFINSKAIANAFPSIATTQKAVAVLNHALADGSVIKFQLRGRTYYAPKGVEII